MGFDKDKFVKWATSNATGAQVNIILYLIDKERSKTMIGRELDMPRQTIEAAFRVLTKRGLVKQTGTIGREKLYKSFLPDEVLQKDGE